MIGAGAVIIHGTRRRSVAGVPARTIRQLGSRRTLRSHGDDPVCCYSRGWAKLHFNRSIYPSKPAPACTYSKEMVMNFVARGFNRIKRMARPLLDTPAGSAALGEAPAGSSSHPR